MTSTAYLDGYQRAMAELLAKVVDDVAPPEGMSAAGLTGYHRGRRDLIDHVEQMAQPWLAGSEHDPMQERAA